MSIERNRSWRRYKNRMNRNGGMDPDAFFKPEKKWKHMYLRREKLSRAKQLGFDYPRKRGRQFLDKELALDE